jgi:hypothetical protein
MSTTNKTKNKVPNGEINNTLENKSPTVLVLTEQSIKKNILSAGYNPEQVVQIKFRVSNVLANDILIEKEVGGYSDIAEFVKESIREKILKDRTVRAHLEIMQKEARGHT